MLEKEMATHSSVLAWRIPGTGKPGGLPSMGLHRVGHDWSDLAVASLVWCICLQHREPFRIRLPYCLVTKSCLILCDPMNCTMPGLPVFHYLPDFAETHVHRASGAIQPSHPLSPPSLALSLSQHWGLFQWISSLHQVAKVLELQHQSFW